MTTQEKVIQSQTDADEELRAARIALIAWWMKDAKRIRKYYQTFYDSLLKILIDQERFDSKDTRLLVGQFEALERKVIKGFTPLTKNVDLEFRNSVRRAIWRASRIQVQYLTKKGAKIPSESELQFLRDDVLRSLDREFPPGSGVTYSHRLQRIHEKHQNQMTSILGSTHTEGAQKRMIQDLDTAMLHTKPQRTPVAGGSMTKDMMRLVASEETRLSNEIELRVLRSAGISLAHWRLSSTHPWYGGQEICEVHATRLNVGLAHELKLRSIIGVPLEGLYKLSQWPTYPHPWCRCFPEAVIL